MNKNIRRSFLITTAFTMVDAGVVHGQNENFPPPPPPPIEDDFSQFDDPGFTPPPPPTSTPPTPPPPSSRTTPTPTSPANQFEIPGRAKPGRETLNSSQKKKFAAAGTEDITNENFPETIESFDFPNAEITDVIKAISELTGKNFIIEPSVRGKITIVAPSKITVAEAYKAFLSALAINSFTVVPSGSFLKIINSRAATRNNIDTYTGAYYPNTDQMITRIVHMKYISAEQVARELRMFNSKDGEMNAYAATNSIIISDYGTAIDRFMRVMSQLDVPGFEEQLIVIPVKYAKAKDLADLIDKIVNKGGGSGGARPGSPPGAFNAGVPRFTRGGTGTSSQQGSSFFMSIPDDRTNSIIVTGNKSGIERVRQLVDQLDFRLSPEDSGGVNVYYVKHGDAKKIATTLQGVTKEASAAGRPAGGIPSPFAPMGPGGFGAQQTEIFGGDVKITADETTNSLVITASRNDYQTVLSILQKLDIARDQVYVEAIISEITLEDGMNWGIGYYKYGESGYGKMGFNSGLNLQSLLNPVSADAGAVLGFATGGPISMKNPLNPGTPIEIPSIIGFINFLKTVSKLNVLSTPQITALDNQKATIEVGSRIPIGTSGTTTTNGVTTQGAPTYEDATIKLELTPFINPTSNSVRMEIDQQLKQPSLSNAAPESLRGSTLTLATRAIKTNIVVNNGDTAVLGGLIQDREVDITRKVPLLGDIPILGWLFKSSEKTSSKINLLVFLTPKIVRNPDHAQQILGSAVEERREAIKSMGGRDPYGERMDRLTRRNSLIDNGQGPTNGENFAPTQDDFEEGFEEYEAPVDEDSLYE